MCRQAVLGDDGGHRRLGELGENGVVPHTQAHYAVQLGAGSVEGFGLGYRVAGGLQLIPGSLSWAGRNRFLSGRRPYSRPSRPLGAWRGIAL